MQKLIHSDNKNTKNAPKLTGNVIPTPAGKKNVIINIGAHLKMVEATFSPRYSENH